MGNRQESEKGKGEEAQSFCTGNGGLGKLGRRERKAGGKREVKSARMTSSSWETKATADPC